MGRRLIRAFSHEATMAQEGRRFFACDYGPVGTSLVQLLSMSSSFLMLGIQLRSSFLGNPPVAGVASREVQISTALC